MASVLHSKSTRGGSEHRQLLQSAVGDQGHLQPCHQTRSRWHARTTRRRSNTIHEVCFLPAENSGNLTCDVRQVSEDGCPP